MARLKLALIGAGNRGADVYGQYILKHADEAEVVAVAEPVAARRERCAMQHELEADQVFVTCDDLLARPKLADAVVIATQDSDHVAPTLAALAAGYDVLLEKPMATSLAGCVALVRAAEQAGRILQIGHVLRYTNFFRAVREIVQSGRLGDVATYEHRENVAYYHMAHSFVRGNWRRKDQSSPMILAKSCHDLDLITWILGEEITHLSSAGTLRHFRRERAPWPDLPVRCTDGCPIEAECPFSAIGIYLDFKPWWPLAAALGVPPDFDLSTFITWPNSTLADGDLRPEAIRHALEAGPYGRCVYHADNDVVDHQIVLLETAAGTSVGFFMHGHSHEEGRTLRIDGSRATLEGSYMLTRQEIHIHEHLTGTTETIRPAENAAEFGHADGDRGLMGAFLETLRRGEGGVLTDARAALESHLLAFAAEEARLNHSVIDMREFRRRAWGG